jgi:hypothetical protein
MSKKEPPETTKYKKKNPERWSFYWIQNFKKSRQVSLNFNTVCLKRPEKD